MSLSRFKRTIIKLDKANNRISQIMLGKEGDYYGRELEVHLLDDGERIDTTGVDLNFQWKNLKSGEFGALPFEEEDAAKGTYVVAYPPEMLTKGDASCAVQIVEGGSTTHTMNFKVSVEGNPLDSEVLMKDNSFKALGEALVKINSLKQQFDDAVGAITEDSEVILARDGFPTLGERLNSQKEDYANYKGSNNLKIATVEKELNDYKSTMANVNVNQEAKQSVAGYGVVSLPKNAANGNVDADVKGNTLFNHADNGAGYVNWVVNGTGTTKGISGIHLVRDGSNGSAITNVNIQAGRQYTVIYNINNHTLINDNTLVINGYNTPAGHRLFGDSINFAPISNELGLNKYLLNVDSGYIGDGLLFGVSSKEIDGAYIDFELYAILEGDWTNKELPFDNELRYGTKSTQSAMRLKSVGKNLANLKEMSKSEKVDVVYENGKTYLTWINDGNIQQHSILKGKFLPNTQYTFKGHFHNIERNNSLHGGLRLKYTDGTTQVIKTTGINLIADFNFVSDPNKTIDCLTGTWEYGALTYLHMDTLQIEKGSIATPYEPYTESTQYLPNVGELRSLPNGAKDEIRVSGGKAELIKRVSDEIILKTNDVIFVETAFENIDMFQLPFPSNMKELKLARVSTILEGSSYVNWDNKENQESIGCYTYNEGRSRIWYIAEKGTPLEQVREQLVGKTLIYELAEPIETPIEVSGTLLSYPSGTVYIENATPDAGIYTDKLNVLDSELPIDYIEKLSKVDFNTGVETELDSSKCVIAEDKLSFTHPDLISNDIVFFTYYHNVEGTQGETTIEYYDSRHTLKDSVTGKFYKIVPTVANGVLVNELVEV